MGLLSKVCPIAESKSMSHPLFNQFLTDLNNFKGKLQKLPDRLLFDSEIDHFFRKKRIKIVVLGGIGVGKSSLLERIIGEEEVRLPKGKDCCTRQPQTIKMPFVTSEENPIEMEFIDLPGITSMPRPDQATDYPLYTQKIFDSHASEADLILLCLPADVDIVNSDALRRLKDLQISEQQIICVLSKIDLLELPVKDLKDFYDATRSFGSAVAVRNAPNLEINNSISETNAKESEFFSQFPELEMLTGVSNLRSEIIRLLSDDFFINRNRITARLIRERCHLQERLLSLSDPNFVTNIISTFIEIVESEISGDRIGRLYWKSLPEALKSVNPLEGIDKDHLKILIKNSQGLKSSLQLEDAFKVLVRSQLKISEMIINEFLDAVMRELRECLHLESAEFEDFTEGLSFSVSDEIEEFYDVKSESISSESESEPDENISYANADDIWEQFKMIPGLCKYINGQVKEILNDAHAVTRKYLDDYCAMQREMIYCDDEEYVEAFREYYRRSRGGGFSGSRVKSNEEIPIRKIESESIDELKDVTFTSENSFISTMDQNASTEADSTGFLKEFMALLFPPVTKIKRVEYRPRPQTRSQIVTSKPMMTAIQRDAQDSQMVQEESFLLKLLEIYLKVYHNRLTDFLPKCLNYHLIGGLRRELSVKLLKLANFSGESNKFGAQIRHIERVIKIIDEINGELYMM